MLISFSSCKSKKYGFVKKTYHNVTARYNGLFNGKIKLAEGIETLNSDVIENYNEPQMVIKPLDVAKAKSIGTLMDKVIEKGSLVIQRHKKSKWVDESYLMVGKAYYHKAEFYTALETFEFVYSTYKKNPSQVEALIWIGKTYIQLEKYSQAQTAFDLASSIIELAPKKKKDLYAAYSQYYISTENSTEAIFELNKALESKGVRKKEKIKYHLILAQLYEKAGNNALAVDEYKMLSKMNAPYEIEFISSMNQAALFDGDKTSDASIEKQLNKMLKDNKNIDFKDQIYYALGGISIKKEKIDQGVLLYKLSVASSTKNTDQKALSYLKLADIYFNEFFDYKEAKNYYDSTATSLNPNHPSYSLVMARKNNLDKLVKNLNEIVLQDSLQKLASLPEIEREKLISKLIKQEKEELRLKQEEKKLALENLKSEAAFDSNQKQGEDQTTLGDADEALSRGTKNWYFYNPQAVGSGYNDFIRLWGRRTLEDNWRRVNKESITSLETEDPETNDEKVVDIKDKKTKLSEDEAAKMKFKKAIPITTAQLDQSNRRIAEAYFNLGSLYREQFNDYPESVKSFEKLLDRFPINQYTMQSLYTLYRLNLDMKNANRAEYYKNKILTEFPNSNFASIIRDPAKKDGRSAKESEANSYYDKIYTAFIKKDYSTVLQLEADVENLFPKTSLAPKFAYLKAMTIGKTQPVSAFETALTSITTNFPTDPVSDLAKNTLAYIAGHKKELESPLYLQRNNPGVNYVSIEKTSIAPDNLSLENSKAVSKESKNPTGDDADYVDKESNSNSIFKQNDSIPHFFAIAVFDTIQNLNSTRLALSNFNKRYFAAKLLKNQTSADVKGFQLVYVKEFKNKEEADLYFLKILENKNSVLTLSEEKYQLFVISDSNLKLLKSRTEVDQYLAFYN